MEGGGKERCIEKRKEIEKGEREEEEGSKGRKERVMWLEEEMNGKGGRKKRERTSI